MKQTERSNSHVVSPKCYNKVLEYLMDSKTYSDRKIIKDFSNDFIVSLEKAVKKLLSSDSLKNIAKDHNNTVYSSKISREILDISTQYSMQFSIISFQFEKWSAQRRLFIKKIENIQKSLNQTKTNCAKTCMFFSAISCTLGLVICDNLNAARWSPKLLFASAAFGCLSLGCSLIEICKTKSSVEEVLKELKEDSKGLQNLQVVFQRMKDFDWSVQNLFPHGMDMKIVRMFQVSDERSPETPRGIHALIEAFPTSKLSKKIWLSIILTNVLKDTTILDDEDFLSKADVFSKSSFAEIWWKRKSKEFPTTSTLETWKSALEANLKVYLKVELSPLYTSPLLMTSLWASRLQRFMFVNALFVLDSYFKLSGIQYSKEVNTLEHLKKLLQKEYKDAMNLYEKLCPHYDW